MFTGCRARGFTGVFVLACSALSAQILIQGSGPGATVRIFNTDAAVLESQDVRKDLPCTVTPVKPALGFDLKFHAGYEVNVPLRDLAGTENTLTMLFRITPDNHKDDPVYFTQKYSVPTIEENAKGDAYLQGGFDVGEGKYHVDWLMRDRSERVCSFYWDVDAELPPKDSQLALEVQPGVIKAADKEPFKEEPPVTRSEHDGPLNVKVMVNFAPQDSQSATLQPLDVNALVSILRSINAGAADRQILHSCLQYAGAARDLSPGEHLADRFPGAGRRAALPSTWDGGS